MALFNNTAHSISADELMRHVGFAQKTAWLFIKKIRSVFSESRKQELLEGTVQIDGGYFCGKPYKANNRNKRDPEAIKDKIINPKKPRRKMTVQEFKNLKKRENRRVVMTFRQISPNPKQGADKTFCFVTMSENEIDATSIARTYIKEGSVIMTDECGAYNGLSTWFDHRVVAHSIQFCTEDGVNDNQCESFFSRPRRCEYGVSHNMRPQYLQSMMDEFAWREDIRHHTNLERFSDLGKRIFQSGFSKFRGYYQWKSKTSEETRWQVFAKPVDGKYGRLTTVSSN
jgi:hypothetical protein